jgi:hypothetical protein
LNKKAEKNGLFQKQAAPTLRLFLPVICQKRPLNFYANVFEIKNTIFINRLFVLLIWYGF